MSYLGNTSTQQTFTPAIDVFSGNGSTTAFTLSRQVATVAQVEAFIENVPQSPVDAFTVSGNTITFTSAPPSGSSNIYVRYTSPITQIMQPSQSSVNTAQLVDSAVTNAKTNFSTVAQFDNSISPATTAFVQRASGSYSGYAYYNANTTLTAADVGKTINMGGGGWTFTLPSAAALADGSKIILLSQGGAHTVVTQLSQTLWKSIANVSSVAVYGSDWAEFTAEGGNWTVSGGSPLVKNAPTYASGTACSYNTAVQAPNDGVVTVQAWGSFMNSFAVYVGTTSAVPNLIATAGNDINNNTWGSSFSFPVKKGSWFKVQQYSIAWDYETVNITFWPY